MILIESWLFPIGSDTFGGPPRVKSEHYRKSHKMAHAIDSSHLAHELTGRFKQLESLKAAHEAHRHFTSEEIFIAMQTQRSLADPLDYGMSTLDHR